MGDGKTPNRLSLKEFRFIEPIIGDRTIPSSSFLLSYNYDVIHEKNYGPKSDVITGED